MSRESVSELVSIAKSSGVNIIMYEGRVAFSPRENFESLPARVQQGLRDAKPVLRLHMDPDGVLREYKQWGPTTSGWPVTGRGRCALCWDVVDGDGYVVMENGALAIYHDACKPPAPARDDAVGGDD